MVMLLPQNAAINKIKRLSKGNETRWHLENINQPRPVPDGE